MLTRAAVDRQGVSQALRSLAFSASLADLRAFSGSLARVIARAEHVWDDRDAAAEWLAQPHSLLGGSRACGNPSSAFFYGIPA